MKSFLLYSSTKQHFLYKYTQSKAGLQQKRAQLRSIRFALFAQMKFTTETRTVM